MKMITNTHPESPARYEQFLTLFAQDHEQLFGYIFSLIVQFLLSRGEPVAVVAPPPASEPAPRYVATLGAMSGCRWSEAVTSLSEGWRLMRGSLDLRKGVAEIRFDSGVTVIIKGPTRLGIETAEAAVLWEGRAVLRGDEVSEGFFLHTLDATLVDIGTEYAESVERHGDSEIHVFDGKVQRRLKRSSGEASSEELTAGEAKRFGASRAAQVPFDADRLFPHVPDAPVRERDAAGILLVTDRFEFAAASLPAEDAGGDGLGWRGPWRGSLEKPGLEIRPLAENDADSPGVFGSGGLWQEGIGERGRIAHEPIRLDVDAVYYVGFVFQRGGEDRKYFLQFRMHEKNDWDPERMLRMGIAHRNLAFFDLGTESVRTHLPLDGDRPYLLVAKIVAGRDRPDQAFLTIYSMSGPLQADEPPNWTLSTAPVEYDAKVDNFWFLFRGEGRQWVDELRIGLTRRSVTVPCWNAIDSAPGRPHAITTEADAARG